MHSFITTTRKRKNDTQDVQSSKVFKKKNSVNMVRKKYSVKMVRTPVIVSPYKWIVKTYKKFVCSRCGRNVFLLLHRCTKSEASEISGFIDMSDKSKKKRTDSWISSIHKNYNMYRNVAKIYRFSAVKPEKNSDYFYRGFFWYQRVFLSDEQLKMLNVLETVCKKEIEYSSD